MKFAGRLAVLGLAFWSARVGAAPDEGLVKPTFDEGRKCGFRVESGQNGAKTADVWVVAWCEFDGTKRYAYQKTRLRPGKVVMPKFKFATGKLLANTRRDGTLLPGRVELHLPGTDFALTPIQIIAANQTTDVTTATYDLKVALEDPSGPPAVAPLRKQRVTANRTRELKVDLSDGFLRVDARANGRKAEVSVRVFRGKKDKDVGSASGGESLRLPPGRYRVRTELLEASDFASHEKEIWISASRTARHNERFSVGDLDVAVSRDGKPLGAVVRIAKAGAGDFFNYFDAPGRVRLTPGKYDLSVEFPAATKMPPMKVGDVRVNAGQVARRRYDVSPATLRVRTLKNGRAVDATVELRTAGGGPIIKSETDGSYRLLPGRYELLGRLEDGAETKEGPFEVKLRQRLRKTLKFVRATLTVRVKRGKVAATDARILVFRPGAAKPTARAAAGARLEIAPGVYDIKVVAGSEIVWKQGVRVKRVLSLDVGLSKTSTSSDPLPSGDVQGPSDALPEGDGG